MNQKSKNSRILAVSLSSPGLGYAVLEGKDALVDFGNMVIKGDKNARSVANIEKLISRYQPEAIVLQDVDDQGSRRGPRIQKLHKQVVALAKESKLKVVTVAGRKLRLVILGDERGTKQEMAESLARRFPGQLPFRLPKKRKDWESEDKRMDIFSAVALAMVLQCANEKGLSDQDNSAS